MSNRSENNTSNGNESNNIPRGNGSQNMQSNKSMDMRSLFFEFRSINNKLNTMTTKNDIKHVVQQTKVLITEAIDLVKNKIHDFRERLVAIEQHQSLATSHISPEMLRILQQSDVANK